MKLRMLVAGTLAIAGVLALPATAMAGEVKGPPSADGFAYGDPTPIVAGVQNENSPKYDEPVAASVCSFSGLNAYHPGKDGTHVQSYGEGVAAGMKDDPMWPSPGFACNPTSGFEE
jgi:hypothetical protein